MYSHHFKLIWLILLTGKCKLRQPKRAKIQTFYFNYLIKVWQPFEFQTKCTIKFTDTARGHITVKNISRFFSFSRIHETNTNCYNENVFISYTTVCSSTYMSLKTKLLGKGDYGEKTETFLLQQKT